MERYVIDASVILKWVLGNEREPDHDVAMGLLHAWVEGRAEISAPKLWQYEVGNFLGRAVPQEAVEKMDLLLKLNITGVDLSQGMCRQCFSWMKDKGVTFYDASYLAVAQEVNATLITADAAFLKKMGKDARISLLKDLNLISE